jgi:hypothetical protein
MVTVLEGVIPKSSVLLCVFLLAKGLNAKDIHKEMFPVYVKKRSSRKAIQNWIDKFSHGRSKVADDEMEVRKWLRQQSRLLCCGFIHTGKAMGQVYQC